MAARLKQSEDEAHAAALEAKDRMHQEAINALQQRFDDAMDAMSAKMKEATDDLLKQRQKEFTETSNQNLGQIVNPLREECGSAE